MRWGICLGMDCVFLWGALFLPFPLSFLALSSLLSYSFLTLPLPFLYPSPTLSLLFSYPFLARSLLFPCSFLCNAVSYAPFPPMLRPFFALFHGISYRDKSYHLTCRTPSVRNQRTGLGEYIQVILGFRNLFCSCLSQ